MDPIPSKSSLDHVQDHVDRVLSDLGRAGIHPQGAAVDGGMFRELGADVELGHVGTRADRARSGSTTCGSRDRGRGLPRPRTRLSIRAGIRSPSWWATWVSGSRIPLVLSKSSDRAFCDLDFAARLGRVSDNSDPGHEDEGEEGGQGRPEYEWIPARIEGGFEAVAGISSRENLEQGGGARDARGPWAGRVQCDDVVSLLKLEFRWTLVRIVTSRTILGQGLDPGVCRR